MSHRAVIYTVKVHKLRKPKDLRLLGDFTDTGAGSLVDTINTCLTAPFNAQWDDGSKVVIGESTVVSNDEVHSRFITGQSGVVADIVDQQGALRLHQESDDTQLVHCASVFRLPATEKLGWWAVHVNNGRSPKGLIQKELMARFKGLYPDLQLSIAPCVLGAALTEAVNRGQVEKVHLIKWEQPHNRAEAATDKWVAANEKARLELQITSAGRGGRVISDRVKKFLGGDTAEFGQIVEFQGIEFEQAKVEVVLGNGSHRTFNIEKPEAGHPISMDLTDLDTQDGEATQASLVAALDRSLDELTS
jgi:hypothetical protein